MSWLSPILGGSTKAQRDACYYLFLKSKEAGRVTTHEWQWVPEEKSRKTYERKKVYERKARKPPKPISFSPNDAHSQAAAAFQMRSQKKLTSEQIAEVLGIDPRTVRKWFKAGPTKLKIK